MQPWHLVHVAMNLRDEDRAEFGALYADTDPQKWACRRALEPGIGFAVVGGDGLPVACFGYFEDHEAVAVGWLVATPRWKCSIKSIKRSFDAIWASNVFETVVAYCRPGREGTKKFLEWLGFRYRGTLPRYARNGEDMEFFSIVRGEAA